MGTLRSVNCAGVQGPPLQKLPDYNSEKKLQAEPEDQGDGHALHHPRRQRDCWCLSTPNPWEQRAWSSVGSGRLWLSSTSRVEGGRLRTGARQEAPLWGW